MSNRRFFVPFLTAILLWLAPHFAYSESPVAIVIHGGAGGFVPKKGDEKTAQQYRDTLKKALHAGNEVLRNGGRSLDAVEASIVILEDSPLFNAGKGAVFTNEGKNELDASIMEGSSFEAGAVGGVTTVKNPIRAARAVMEKTPHVMLMGHGADQFARQAGLKIVERSYFHTEKRWNQWQKTKNDGFAPGLRPAGEKPSARNSDETGNRYLGTVGAVALDRQGHIAAGTSTGGLTNKRYGRIGDSPIIAAGTYANNETCGISCTGHGESFIRHVVAHDISARMAYANHSLAKAAREVIQVKLKQAGGRGGIIGLDRKGNIAVEFNTPGMFRAWIGADGEERIEIGE